MSGRLGLWIGTHFHKNGVFADFDNAAQVNEQIGTEKALAARHDDAECLAFGEREHHVAHPAKFFAVLHVDDFLLFELTISRFHTFSLCASPAKCSLFHGS